MPWINRMPKDIYQTFLHKHLVHAGDLALSFAQNRQVNYKQDASLVTQADTVIDRYLREQIEAAYPGTNIYSEEEGGTLESAQQTWIIDPIEGTTNYAHGVPVYGIQVAISSNQSIMAAAMYDPVSKTFIYAEKGKGTYLNQQKVRIETQPIESSTLLFDTGRNKELTQKFLQSGAISQFRSFRRFGSLITDVTFMLSHRCSVYMGFSAKVYDFAPAALLLEEAGYQVIDDSLTTWKPTETCSLFAFSPEHYQKIVSIVSTITSNTA
jgi:myo-inositol-1(or 4)-monophosphatase